MEQGIVDFTFQSIASGLLEDVQVIKQLPAMSLFDRFGFLDLVDHSIPQVDEIEFDSFERHFFPRLSSIRLIMDQPSDVHVLRLLLHLKVPRKEPEFPMADEVVIDFSAGGQLVLEIGKPSRFLNGRLLNWKVSILRKNTLRYPPEADDGSR